MYFIVISEHVFFLQIKIRIPGLVLMKLRKVIDKYKMHKILESVESILPTKDKLPHGSKLALKHYVVEVYQENIRL
jgi:hypothetical protein